MTDVRGWETLYGAAIRRAMERLESVPGVALGFHTNIDGLVRLKPGMVEDLLSGLDSARILGALDAPAGLRDIKSAEDFAAGLLISLESGSAKQLMIKDEGVYRWLMEKLPPEKLRLGGTTANMSNALSGLPVKRILNYAFPLTRQQAELFPERENILALVPQDGSFTLKKIREAFDGEGFPSCHWVLEYPRDLEASFGGRKFLTSRANRYIAAWNPSNSRLKIQDSFRRGFMTIADTFSHFFISGFHIMSETYPEGASCEDYIRAAAEFLREARERAPGLCVHYELASIASPRIRKAVFSTVVPRVNSIGLNEAELRTALGDMGREGAAGGRGGAAELLSGLRAFSEATGVERVHLHCPGFYVALIRGGRWEMRGTRDALLFSAAAAAGRALTGTVGSDALEAGSAAPISSDGMKALSDIGKSDPKLRGLTEEGIAGARGDFMSAVPTRWVAEPQFTVGLGDTISSTALLAS